LSKPITEKEIEFSILQYLASQGIFCWKQNTVGVWDAQKRIFRKSNNPFILRGISDILGIFQGKFLAIEVKTPQRRSTLSDFQKQFIESINTNGGLAFMATSVKDVMERLNAPL
jgi:penicillin-binding protein-related factor A (putative recombinase)